MRTVPLVAGVLMMTASFVMANAVDRGLTRPWADGLRLTWALVLIALMLAGIFTLAVGLGVLSEEVFAEVGDARARVPTVPEFIAVYVGLLIVAAGTAIYVERSYGINYERSVAVVGGGIFLIASLGRPWWLFSTLRRLGWFAAIASDRTMKVVLASIGALLLVLGLRTGAT